jgi:acid phosphatase family membrane protein YuiD
MPSAHSAVVVSLATAVAIKYGVTSDLFAITMAFTGIIIYDALNVRFEAGLHASTINDFL